MTNCEFEFNPYGSLSAYHGSDAHVRIPRREPKFHICSRAFANNKSLEVVEIPEGVYSIEKEAFMDCENLREVILPSTMHTISNHAFAGCGNLRSIRFPSGIDPTLYTTPSTFDGCRALGDENGMIIIGGALRSYCGDGGSVTVTDGVRSIDPGVFARIESITVLHLPEGLEQIGREAFRGCRNLTQINIPRSVTRADRSAFDGCDGLYQPDSDFLVLDGWLCGYRGPREHVEIPRGVTSITDNMFYIYRPQYGASAPEDRLAGVIIPEGVTRIGSWAFMECRALTEITLPESLRILDCMAFADCSGLKTINLPAGLTELGGRVFENCTSLEEITIPSGIREVPGDAFRNCSALTAVRLPEGITAIGANAFSGCGNLRSISVPESVVSVGENAFDGCPGLIRKDGLIIAAGCVSGYHGPGGEVIVPEGVTEINSHAFQGSRITRVILPRGLRKIHPLAFSGCRELETVILPDGLEYIGEDAFQDCALTQIDLPEGLQHIGREAFSGSIREVSLPKSLQHLGNLAFRSCPVRKLTIPQGLFRDYGTVPGENSCWIDNDIDINPFNYKDGQIICANVICRSLLPDSRTVDIWARILRYENHMFQIWTEDGEEISLWEIWEEQEYLVSILNLDRITALIREDDISVMDYLSEQGTENLQTLLAIAEEAQAKQVTALLQEKLA